MAKSFIPHQIMAGSAKVRGAEAAKTAADNAEYAKGEAMLATASAPKPPKAPAKAKAPATMKQKVSKFERQTAMY